MSNVKYDMPKKDDRIEITIKNPDGRSKEKKIIVGPVIEEYPNFIIVLNEKINVRESFMRIDFRNNAVDFKYLNSAVTH